ncbi:MAG: poly(R)-hydroxyalkanoic acid synthase subunit PhaE [Pseudomonadota bacterium]
MDWTEQAETMIKAATEAQKKAWEGWYELARKGTGSMTTHPNDLDPANLFKQALQGWSEPRDSSTKDAAEQVYSGQRVMLNTLELLTKSWQIVAPNLASGEDWQEDLQKFTKQWTDQTLGSPQLLLENAGNVQQLWTSFISEWGPLLKPWLASLNQIAHGHIGEGLMGGGSALNRFLNLEMDGLTHLFNIEADREMAFERVAELPSIGQSREQNAKMLRAFDAFIDLRKVDAKYRSTLAAAMADAVKRVMEKLAGLAEEGKSITSVRGLNRLWLDTADEVFTEMYASAEYTELQKDLSSAGLRYKIEARKVVEMVLKALDIPTRSELDDAYRTLYELRKEVKELKRTLRSTSPQSAPKPSVKKRKIAPRRKSTAKKKSMPKKKPAVAKKVLAK